MYKIIYIITPLLFCCTGEKKAAIGAAEEVEDKNISRVINIDDAFNDIREIRLSDIADSISFLPIETHPNCLISTLNFFSFSPHYIFFMEAILIGLVNIADQ